MRPTDKSIQKELQQAMQVHANAEHKKLMAEAEMKMAEATIVLLKKRLNDLKIEKDGDGEEFFDAVESEVLPFATGDKVVRASPYDEEKRRGKRATGRVIAWVGSKKDPRVRTQFDDRNSPGHYKPQNLRKYYGKRPSLQF